MELRDVLWRQMGASIDMLTNAVEACPESVWTGTNFWYVAYHCCFYLDYYASENPVEFMPPAPFSLSEFDPSGRLPERIYERVEILQYLAFARNKNRNFIALLDEENQERRFKNDYKDFSFVELVLYNIRHVQHHAGQLYMMLRQQVDSVPNWVSEAADHWES